MTQRDLWNDWKAPDDLKECVRLLFAILEAKEETDSGRAFRPTHITSVRIWDTHRLNKLIPKMKELLDEGGDVSPPCS